LFCQGLLEIYCTSAFIALGDFEKAKQVDKVNEKRPPVAASENQPSVPAQNTKLQSLRMSQEQQKG
jgi:hypothetical protein